MEYDSEAFSQQYEVMELRIVHRRRCTGFEDSKDFPVRNNDLIAGRYQVWQRDATTSLSNGAGSGVNHSWKSKE